MCSLIELLTNQTFLSLVIGVVGAVIGVVGSVWATNAVIKSNSAEYDRQKRLEKDDEYAAKLENLRNEIEFNIQLPASNKRMSVFVFKAWESFLQHSHRINIEDRKILNEAYSWALFHNNAAQLDPATAMGTAPCVDSSFDEAVSKFKELYKRQLKFLLPN